MFPVTYSQPSLPRVGRDGSTARSRWCTARTASRWSSRCSAAGTPQLSLNGTQATTQAWLASRSTAASHSRTVLATDRELNR